MVKKPEEYPWSSYHANAQGTHHPLVSPHDICVGLDTNPVDRCYHYRELFRVHLSECDVHTIRECLAANQVVGDDRFRVQDEAALNKKLGYMKPGRPLLKLGVDRK